MKHANIKFTMVSSSTIVPYCILVLCDTTLHYPLSLDIVFLHNGSYYYCVHSTDYHIDHHGDCVKP